MANGNLLSSWPLPAVVLVVVFLYVLIVRKRKGPMPPGPAGWPILGNALDVPLDYSWHAFAKWAERWGESVSAHPHPATIR